MFKRITINLIALLAALMLSAAALAGNSNNQDPEDPVEDLESTAEVLPVGEPTDVRYIDGRLGIGTSSPFTTLDVKGNIAMSHDNPYVLVNTNDKNLALSGGSGWTQTGAVILLHGLDDNANSHGMGFYTGDKRSMILDSQGNLGIGVGSPSATLDVAGHIALSNSDPYVRVNTDDKNLALSGGSGWSQTGAVILLHGLDDNSNSHGMGFYTGDKRSMILDSQGNLGIGVGSPSATLDVAGHIALSNSDPYVRVNTDDKYLALSGGSGWSQTGALILLHGHDSSTNSHGMGFYTGDRRSMVLDASGNLSVVGTVTTGSSRELKNNIAQLSGDEAVAALMSLMPVKYNYKTNSDELELGFIAEDVPDLVARNDRKSLSPMDFAALSVTVIQEQQKQIEELRALVSELINDKK